MHVTVLLDRRYRDEDGEEPQVSNYQTAGYPASTSTSRNGSRTICRTLALARAAFAAAVEEKPAGNRIRIVKRHRLVTMP
jgi:hypothetical protein